MGLLLSAPMLNSLWAGLATGLGALVVVGMNENPSRLVMALALSFAAGVMITVSIADMIVPAFRDARSVAHIWALVACVLGGSLLMFVVSKLLPTDVESALPFLQAPDSGEAALAKKVDEESGGRNPSKQDSPSASLLEGDEGATTRERAVAERDPAPALGVAVPASAPEKDSRASDRARSARLAAVMCCALTAHNFPEGIAVAASSLSSAKQGVAMAIAIGLHNAVEGVSIAVPVLAATQSRVKAIAAALLSGLTEPLGALLALLLIGQASAGADAGPQSAMAYKDWLSGVICLVAGVMVQVSLQELLPEAYENARQGTVPLVSGPWKVAAILIAGLKAGVGIVLATMWAMDAF
jgi:zinc transporter ZupT